MNLSSIACGFTVGALLLPGVAAAAFIRPNSATAVSEYNGSYSINWAINGAGLPPNFGPTSAHAGYDVNNHWTTKENAVGAGTARATFSFNQPVNLDGFYLWNHLSGFGPYYVTQFDLIFKDGNNTVVGSLLNQPAAGGINFAQAYNFAPMVGVRHVDFIIDSHGGSLYTGVAEVAFDDTPNSAIGNFNSDGSIDAADYVVWRKNPAGTYSQADYNTWRAQFGESVGSGATAESSNTAVPEPATLVLLALAATGVPIRSPRRTLVSTLINGDNCQQFTHFRASGSP